MRFQHPETLQSQSEQHRRKELFFYSVLKKGDFGRLFFCKQKADIYIYKKRHTMIIVKKEYLDEKVSHYRLTLGEMNQHQLEHIQSRFGDKYFETQKKKKKIKHDSSD
jgi:hypothetical protein